MDYFIIQGNDRIRLPVIPPSFEVQCGQLNQTITVGNIGEVNFIGKNKLATISFSSFFPAQNYYFSKPTYTAPYVYVNIIKKMKTKGVVRLLITGTNINNLFTIENFTYSEKDGTADVYFTLEFKEYKRLVADVKDINGNKKQPVRSGRRATPKTYTVKKGDSLYTIAKWWYGDGNKYMELAKKNNLLNAGALKIGTVLKL